MIKSIIILENSLRGSVIMDIFMDILGFLKYIAIGILSLFVIGIALAIVTDMFSSFIRRNCIHNNCTILYIISSNNVCN